MIQCRARSEKAEFRGLDAAWQFLDARKVSTEAAALLNCVSSAEQAQDSRET
jgi:hypothetical protein